MSESVTKKERRGKLAFSWTLSAAAKEDARVLDLKSVKSLLFSTSLNITHRKHLFHPGSSLVRLLTLLLTRLQISVQDNFLPLERDL